ncbi:MAG TPA: 50S ribosomal protein L10, partial [Rhodospirillaceae bacterium]|nr:50S ribosomal protein L10 [Rhodospirillaceae bacterium]
MDRKEKSELVAALHEKFVEAGLVVVTHNQGLTVAEVTDLRRKVRSAGAGFKVTKNRLTRL